MKKIYKLKTRVVILMSAFVSMAFGPMHADDYVVEDIDFYRDRHAIHAASIKAAEADGYLELHIEPANKDGISVNIFKILDTTRLKGLLIVNSISPEFIDGIGYVHENQNLEHSLTPDHCATTIVIEVANRFPTADTYLQGLIRIVGKQAKIVIISATGVSLNGAFFQNLEQLHIKSGDTQSYGNCYSSPCARNIRVNSAGIHADCPVFFYSKHTVIDGIINLPNHLTLQVESICLFSKNVNVIELGDLTAECKDRFINRGRIVVKRDVSISTQKFENGHEFSNDLININYEPVRKKP